MDHIHQVCRCGGYEAHCRGCHQEWPCRTWLLAENDRLGTELADASMRAGAAEQTAEELTAALAIVEEELACTRAYVPVGGGE
jgi:hypothetical protein